MNIGFCNMNFWKPVYADMKFSEKQEYLVEKAKNEEPVIIAVNEHASNQGLIDNLDEKLGGDYSVVKPYFDNVSHPRSLQNLLIIRDGIKYTVQDVNCSLPNRLNVVDVYLLGEDKTPIRIINLYMVQTAILRPHMRNVRENLSKRLWEEIRELLESEEYRRIPTIVIGDLQEASSGENIRYLTEKLGYVELVEGFAPVSTFNNKTIDHVLFSREAREILKPRNYSVNNDALSYSDHPYISVEVAWYMVNNIININEYKKKQFNKLLRSNPKYYEINKIHFAVIC